MTEITIPIEDSPYIFKWVEGCKTVNICNPGESLAFTCVSFDHHKSVTSLADAKRAIKHWRADNE